MGFNLSSATAVISNFSGIIDGVKHAIYVAWTAVLEVIGRILLLVPDWVVVMLIVFCFLFDLYTVYWFVTHKKEVGSVVG